MVILFLVLLGLLTGCGDVDFSTKYEIMVQPLASDVPIRHSFARYKTAEFCNDAAKLTAESDVRIHSSHMISFQTTREGFPIYQGSHHYPSLYFCRSMTPAMEDLKKWWAEQQQKI
jgi:hypothetical protein